MIYSSFNYGHAITKENKFFPIDEGSGEINVELRVRSYTLGQFVIELNRALNEFGSNQYQVILDRNTGKITIYSDGQFTILINSSDLKVVSCYELAGFTGNVNLVAIGNEEPEEVFSIEADAICGKVFNPQFELQNYIDFEDSQRAGNASINESASGKVEVVKFGNVKFMTANITMQTNITQVSDCNFVSPIKPDPNGYENLRNFLLYTTTKAPIEFVRNIENRNTFTNCILESTPNDSNGTGFEIIQLYSRGLVGYYESGNLTFRAI
jgi:hypothetical protein